MVIVLLTQHYYLDRMNVEERLALFRKNCSLEQRSTLFLLPTSGVDLIEFTGNVESSLADAAHVYYKDETRRFRKKQSKLNRITHLEWFLHYDFKMAVFYEFRRDYENAIK